MTEDPPLFIGAATEMPSPFFDDALDPAPFTLKQALGMLKNEVNAHWTWEGVPSLTALGFFVGRQVYRIEVDAASPGLRRGV